MRAAPFGQIAALLAVTLCRPAAAQPPPDALRAVNDTAIAIYQDAKRRYLAAADPVVIVGFGSVLIREGGQSRRVARTPADFDQLKSVGHVPRSLWAALRPAIDGLDPEQAWRRHLAGLRPRTVAAMDALPHTGLPPAIIARDTAMLATCLSLIDRSLAQGLPTQAELQGALRSMAPTILADTAEAGKSLIDSLDRDVRPWWNGLTPQQRARTFIVVVGPKTPRDGNAAYVYFVNLLGPAEDGHRVVYAEGIYDEAGADALLATLATDRRLSIDLFDDERRMERDVLADGALARILELSGRLGTR